MIVATTSLAAKVDVWCCSTQGGDRVVQPERGKGLWEGMMHLDLGDKGRGIEQGGGKEEARNIDLLILDYKKF